MANYTYTEDSPLRGKVTKTMYGLDPYAAPSAGGAGSGMSEDQIMGAIGSLYGGAAQNQQLQLKSAQDYADRVFARNQQLAGDIFDKNLMANQLLNENAYRSGGAGPIYMDNAGYAGQTMKGMSPRVVVGGIGFNSPVLYEKMQNQARINEYLDTILGLLKGNGGGSGANFDAILASMNADLDKRTKQAQTAADQRMASLGRNVTGTVGMQNQQQILDDRNRAGLGAMAEVEKLRMQDFATRQNQINALISTVLPTLFRSLTGGGGGGSFSVTSSPTSGGMTY